MARIPPSRTVPACAAVAPGFNRATTAEKDKQRERVALHELGHFFMQIDPHLRNGLGWDEVALEEIIADFPEVIFGVHICRGNRQSMWHREGHYDAIAEKLFNGLKHQRLLLEYDTERAGGFEPLRFVPKGKLAVLGLITTKIARIETVDELRRRIDEAARYIPVEQLAISPQCGFASSLRGNLLTEDEQFRKLDVMLETAAKVWGV